MTDSERVELEGIKKTLETVFELSAESVGVRAARTRAALNDLEAFLRRSAPQSGFDYGRISRALQEFRNDILAELKN